MRKKLDLTQLLTLGAVLVTLAFAVPSYVTAQSQADSARAQAEITEQGQITDRFNKSIEQLGSDKLHIRLGGIYALHRIAHDSQRDHPTVMNVLAAFVREEMKTLRPTEDGPCPDQPPTADVQAALTALGRPHPDWDTGELDLSSSCLNQAYLTGANLGGANLTNTDLTNANLRGANLTGASLNSASLNSADLTNADLTDADLTDADLISTDLFRANLRGANLTNAFLGGTNLDGAFLGDAFLDGANLTSAHLNHAYLDGASLTSADLTSAFLYDADLTGADFTNANLTSADLDYADLTKADLTNARLTNADLTGAKGLTREQLGRAASLERVRGMPQW